MVAELKVIIMKEAILDLVVINSDNPAMPLNYFSELKEAIIESNFPVLVDIHDWATVPISFQNQIKIALCCDLPIMFAKICTFQNQ